MIGQFITPVLYINLTDTDPKDVFVSGGVQSNRLLYFISQKTLETLKTGLFVRPSLVTRPEKNNNWLSYISDLKQI